MQWHNTGRTGKRIPVTENASRFRSPPSHIDEEGKRRVNDILIAGILFPAIPLAMNNVSGRYTAVAGLIRNLHDTMEQPHLSATKHSIFMAELVSLKRRMHLIKASQFFGGLAFVFNLLFVLATYLSIVTISPLLFPTAIILMAVSMSLFVVEIYLSTGALRIHIGDVETLREKTGS